MNTSMVSLRNRHNTAKPPLAHCSAQPGPSLVDSAVFRASPREIRAGAHRTRSDRHHCLQREKLSGPEGSAFRAELSQDFYDRIHGPETIEQEVYVTYRSCSSGRRFAQTLHRRTTADHARVPGTAKWRMTRSQFPVLMTRRLQFPPTRIAGRR
jgi:hypothetical protein